jgi:predicted MFS family arabinose efflux permease
MDNNFIPIAMFAMIAAIVIVPTWLKSKERRDMQATLRASIDKGQALPPEVIDALTRQTVKPPATAGRDLRTGVILLALSLGIAAAFSYLGSVVEDDVPYGFAAFAAIPGAVGLAFIVLSFFNKNKD